MKLLNRLRRTLEFRRKGIKVWYPCNIYPSASIGNDVSIGMFSEIGSDVIIGDGTRIGMGCFIPKGVTIGKGCFLAPRVCFVHDMIEWTEYPNGEDHWQQTVIEDGATIGANVLVRPGVRVGKGALIGIGAVVTKDVGPNEVWFGNPARKVRQRT